MKKIFIKWCILIAASILLCITAAYAQEKLDESYFQGYAVQFDYQGHKKERKIIYDFFLNNLFLKYRELVFHPLQKDELGIDLYDVDDDGQMEILVYLNNPDNCGSHGCSFYIFKKTSNRKYQPLWWNDEKTNSSVITLLDVKFLTKKTKGFHDIVFYGSRFIGSPFTYAVWQWQGEYYKWAESSGND